MKKRCSRCLPPAFWRLYNRLVRRVGYFGNYPTWDSARKATTGYDSGLILQRVRDALLKVKRGEAAYERDSVLFDAVQHAWPLLAGLLWAASLKGNRLRLIDFGGSLGSTYFQNRSFLSHLEELSWNIVEQEQFVECGRQEFADGHLAFYRDIKECTDAGPIDLVLLSSVLPYIERPYDLLEQVVRLGCEFIIVDRTPLLDEGADRITVQRVPAEIYRASYPAWMLSRQNFLAAFSANYEIIAEFDALAGTIDLGDGQARDRGFIFRKTRDR